jgi:hypothetical protein
LSCSRLSIFSVCHIEGRRIARERGLSCVLKASLRRAGSNVGMEGGHQPSPSLSYPGVSANRTFKIKESRDNLQKGRKPP